MPKVFTNEVKTGLVVILCAVILTGLTIMAGNFKVFSDTYNINALFSNAAGIEKGAPVRLSGVEAGKVLSVGLVYKKEGDTIVNMSLEIDKNFRIRNGAKASITTLGLMGEKYIELSPGDIGAPFLKHGDCVQGKAPIDMDAIIEEAVSTMEAAKETMSNISTLTKSLNSAVSDNRGNIDEIMNNLRRTTDNLEEFTDDIKRNPWKLLVKGKDK